MEEVETISYEEQPKGEVWALIPLYKTTLEGKKSCWQIGFDGQLWIKHGLSISTPQIKYREVKTNNSGRTLQEQALLEARNRYKKMYYKGYYPAGGAILINEPMLANNYKVGSLKNFPVAIQPKLDGVRALLTLSPEGVIILSRTGRPWSHLLGIRKEIEELFQFLPPGAILDGEVYSTELSFDQLSGIMRTTKKSRVGEEKLRYYIFDLICDSYFEIRYTCLERAFSSCELKLSSLIPTYMAYSHEDIVEAHSEWVSQGFEGVMIRRLSFAEPKRELSLYKPRRSNNLLKYKSFNDEEVTIIGVDEGEGTEKGLAMFTVKDDLGNVFNVRPQGDFQKRKEWFTNPSLVLRKRYTIKYFGKTEKGIPRFPVGITIRNYE